MVRRRGVVLMDSPKGQCEWSLVVAAPRARWRRLILTTAPGLLLYQLALPLRLAVGARRQTQAFAAAPFAKEWKRGWLLIGWP